VPWEEVLGNAEKKDFSDVSEDDVRKALINKLNQDAWWERMIRNNDIILEDHWVRTE
jgi:hypothetical protein